MANRLPGPKNLPCQTGIKPTLPCQTGIKTLSSELDDITDKVKVQTRFAANQIKDLKIHVQESQKLHEEMAQKMQIQVEEMLQEWQKMHQEMLQESQKLMHQEMAQIKRTTAELGRRIQDLEEEHYPSYESNVASL
jgi:uncharacterized protein YydD (DUF2326 family)